MRESNSEGILYIHRHVSMIIARLISPVNFTPIVMRVVIHSRKLSKTKFPQASHCRPFHISRIEADAKLLERASRDRRNFSVEIINGSHKSSAESKRNVLKNTRRRCRIPKTKRNERARPKRSNDRLIKQSIISIRFVSTSPEISRIARMIESEEERSIFTRWDSR